MNTGDKNKIQSSITIEGEPVEIWNTLVAFSNYRSWNPAVSHAVIYGPVATGSEIKMLSGKWDLRFAITGVFPPETLEIEGGGAGLKIKLSVNIFRGKDSSDVRIEAVTAGWLSKLFPKRISRGVEDSINLFLISLQRRITRGSSYEIKRENEKPDDDEYGRRSYMPTPFRLLYKSRKRKSRKGRSRLR